MDFCPSALAEPRAGPGSEGGWNDDQCLCHSWYQLLHWCLSALISLLLSGQWCPAGMAGIQSSCQLFTTALCPSPAAAQLDSIGFSIIKKCIHAVETRGRAALGQLLAVEQLLSCPFHGQNDS